MHSRIDILQHHQLSGSYTLFSLNCTSCKNFHNIENCSLWLLPCISSPALQRQIFLTGPYFHKFFTTLILTTVFTVSEIAITPFYISYLCRKQNCKGCKSKNCLLHLPVVRQDYLSL